MANKVKNVLKATTDSELLSYIINVTPELQELDLPVQGESIAPIGKLISSNERYRNAFIKTVNLIGLTVIKRNAWENPWIGFTDRGVLNYGQQVRELILDLCDVYDYNENRENNTKFLETSIPNVFNYIHEVNFQKYYETTTSDQDIRMAFNSEGGLFDFVEKAISMLYESWKYDKYIVDKYMLCRRIVDGTVTPIMIQNYQNLTARQRVAKIKNVSNLMTFRNPNFNPAGIRKATNFDDQIAIINTDFEADLTTEVLATSFFRNEAEMKSRLALVDGFANHDDARLTELLGDKYVKFTDTELNMLAQVPVVIISSEWFMDYQYAFDNESNLKKTEFYNPTTLNNNHFLHVWAVFSTSPFEQGAVFTQDQPSVTTITISPSESTVSAGLGVQLTAKVETTGFANKAVQWAVDAAPGQKPGGGKVTVDMNGYVQVPSDYTPTNVDSNVNPIVISATSIFDTTKKQTATITVV